MGRGLGRVLAGRRDTASGWKARRLGPAGPGRRAQGQVWAVLAAWAWVLGSCGGGGPEGREAGVEWQDRWVAPDRADRPPEWHDADLDGGDGSLDASSLLGDTSRPEPVEYDFCSEPVWMVPRHGPEESENSVVVDACDGNLLAYEVYGYQDGHPLGVRPYFLDLGRCREYPLAQICPFQNAAVSGLRDGRMVMFCLGAETVVHYLVEVASWDIRILGVEPRDWGGSEVTSVLSRDAIVFFQVGANGQRVRVDVASLATMESRTVYDGALSMTYLAITDDLFVFEPEDPGCSYGFSTMYVNLHDLSVGQVEGTCDEYGEHLYTASGWRVAYEQLRGLGPGPTRCAVTDVREGWVQVLTEDDRTYCAGQIAGDIVFWNTGIYRTDSGTSGLKGDIMAMDLETGLVRRLTYEPRYIGAAAVPTTLPWLVLAGWKRGISVTLWWVANLEAVGVVDGDGRLLPGSPLDELTELGDP